MRVITGSARGRKLVTLDGRDVRPTTDMVKEAMFSILHFELEQAMVLDLFAGSGQLAVKPPAKESSRNTVSVKVVDCSGKGAGSDAAARLAAMVSMSRDIEGLPETSLNLGILKTEESEISAEFCIRSSVLLNKEELKSQMCIRDSSS